MSAPRNITGALAAMTLTNAGSLTGFAIAANTLGTDQALEHGTWHHSDTFAATVIAATALAAIIAGAVCHLISRHQRTAILVAAILFAWWALENTVRLELLQDHTCQPRNPTESFIDGAQHDLLFEPRWSAIASPLVVSAGVILGATLAARRTTP